MPSPRIVGCLLGLAMSPCPAVVASAADCAALAAIKLPAVTIARAELVPAGSYSPPGWKPLANLPAFCRVAGVIKPSDDSDIRFEVWMPATGWSGRFHGVGNGGFAGQITYDALAAAVRRGDASASTDTGHESINATDARWALGHPEKITDFGYRAIHETTVAAKAIIRAFYGEPARHSYFTSCSNGGRQGLMEAQRYPDDYDGILAGAPAYYWTHLVANGAWDLNALDGDSYIPPDKLPAIEAAALAACDALDGVKDGTIENAGTCHPDVSALACREAESASCLTAPQLAALRKLYAGSRTAKGLMFFPGYPPGGEAERGGWAVWITGPAPKQSLLYAFGTQFFGNMVFGDPAWDYRTFDLDRDAKTADDKVGSQLNAIDPDLRRFQARDGKLVLYHGWSDAAIPAGASIAYYESVLAKTGLRNAESFVRLFLVPGMQHCSGGSGTTLFGQPGTPRGDAEHDITSALERWVEQGVAPKQVIAAKLKDPADPKSGIARTRPLCPYPLVATYKGSGSTDEAANFTCAPPRTVSK